MLLSVLAVASLAVGTPDAGQGRASLDCRVTSKGRLEACLVVSEQPKGANVGAFALKLVRAYRIALSDRRIHQGRIRITLRFKLPEKS